MLGTENEGQAGLYSFCEKYDNKTPSNSINVTKFYRDLGMNSDV